MITDVKTSPEWQKYYADLEKHEQFYKDYQFYLERIVRHLEWKSAGKSWSVKEIQDVIRAEIEMGRSCDAPNKPGYYRANND